MTKQLYNDENLARFKLWLSNASDQEHKRYFEVLVDGMKIIYKTDDLGKLDDLPMWVDGSAKIIKVHVYSSPGSHRYQTFEFQTENYVQEQEETKQKKEVSNQQTLSGIDVDKKISEAITQVKKEQAFDELKKENKSLNEKLSDANIYIEKLEGKVHQFESQKLKLDKETFISIGGGILGNVVRTNPEILNKIPGLDGIASALTGNNGAKPENDTPEVEVTIKKIVPENENKTEENTNENDNEELEGLSEEEEAKLNLFEVAEENLNDEEYAMYFEIVQFLAHHPKLVPTIYGLLKDESSRYKQAA